MQEKYECKNGTFVLIDEELGLNLTGELDYLEKDYFPSGELRYTVYRKEDKLHGPSIYYGKSGEVLSETWYFHGQKMGKVRRFYPTGDLYSIERFVNGIHHLAQEYFYLDGQTKTIIHYNQGKLDGETILYWPDGLIKRRCAFTNGEKVGEEEFYDEEGNPIDQTASALS